MTAINFSDSELQAFSNFVNRCCLDFLFKNPDKPITRARMMQKCGIFWKDMSYELKMGFLPENSEMEVARITPFLESRPFETTEPGKKRKRGKRPKLPIGAYAMFLRDNFKSVQADHPEWDKDRSTKISNTHKELRKQWECMSSVSRQIYEEAEVKDKRRYEREMDEYKRTGAFTPLDLDGNPLPNNDAALKERRSRSRKRHRKPSKELVENLEWPHQVINKNQVNEPLDYKYETADALATADPNWGFYEQDLIPTISFSSSDGGLQLIMDNYQFQAESTSQAQAEEALATTEAPASDEAPIQLGRKPPSPTNTALSTADEMEEGEVTGDEDHELSEFLVMDDEEINKNRDL